MCEFYLDFAGYNTLRFAHLVLVFHLYLQHFGHPTVYLWWYLRHFGRHALNVCMYL